MENQFKFKAPARPLCMTYTDNDNNMLKVYYNENGIERVEPIQLPPEDERQHISCIMEYVDGTILTTRVDDSGKTFIEINKPVIYNQETGEIEVNKNQI